MLRIADFLTLFGLLFAGYLVVVFVSCFIGWHGPLWAFSEWSGIARAVFFFYAVPCSVIALWPETKSGRRGP